jgi:chorismate mutase
MDIPELRKKIDLIDEQVLELLNKRADIAICIGKVKKGHNISVIHNEREEEILGRLESANKGPLSRLDVRSIYSTIIKACRELQHSEFNNMPFDKMNNKRGAQIGHSHER